MMFCIWLFRHYWGDWFTTHRSVRKIKSTPHEMRVCDLCGKEQHRKL